MRFPCYSLVALGLMAQSVHAQSDNDLMRLMEAVERRRLDMSDVQRAESGMFRITLDWWKAAFNAQNKPVTIMPMPQEVINRAASESRARIRLDLAAFFNRLLIEDFMEFQSRFVAGGTANDLACFIAGYGYPPPRSDGGSTRSLRRY